MTRNMNENLKKAITMGRRSGDFRRAFKDAGGEKLCGTWGNALRQFNTAVAASETEPQKPPAKTPAKPTAAAPAAASASNAAPTQTRTGTLKAPVLRQTSQQVGACRMHGITGRRFDVAKDACRTACSLGRRQSTPGSGSGGGVSEPARARDRESMSWCGVYGAVTDMDTSTVGGRVTVLVQYAHVRVSSMYGCLRQFSILPNT